MAEIMKQETTFFDLLVEDILITNVAQYLSLDDLMNLRVCSRKCKDRADAMLAGIRSFTLTTDKGDMELFIKRTRRLLELSICGVYYTDEMLHHVLSNNRLLNQFSMKSMSYSPKISSWALMPLAECQDLSHLHLSKVPISDDLLRALSGNKLKSVSFLIDKYNEKVERPSQAALQFFFEKQTIIESVDLFHTIDLSPIVSTIANFCPNLKKLEIAHCMLCDSKVLIELADKCPKLFNLNVKGTFGFGDRDEVLNELRSNIKYHRNLLDPTDRDIQSFGMYYRNIYAISVLDGTDGTFFDEF